MKSFIRIILVTMIALAAFLPFGQTVHAKANVIEFSGTEVCMIEVDPSLYMTTLPSGEIQIRNMPIRCINSVFDNQTGAPVIPVNIDHDIHYNANLRPYHTDFPYDWDGIGQYWGDCDGSGWNAHFEGAVTPEGTTSYIHGVGEIGGPLEGMMFQMNSIALNTTGVTTLTGRLIVQNDK